MTVLVSKYLLMCTGSSNLHIGTLHFRYKASKTVLCSTNIFRFSPLPIVGVLRGEDSALVLLFAPLVCRAFHRPTDYGRPERKQPSLHGRKFNPNPKFSGTAEAYFVCHIGPIFQISLSQAFIGCPQSVVPSK